MTIPRRSITDYYDDSSPEARAERDLHMADHNKLHKKANAVINVKADYGATGDGVTDDTANLQGAVDAAQDAGGGLVAYPPGTFVGDVVVEEDNVLLVGSGPVSKLVSATSSEPVRFLNCDYWGIRDFQLDGLWDGSRGVVLEGARWGTVLNIVGDRFSQPMLDMRGDGAATQNVNNNLIQHFHVENCTRFIRFQGGDVGSGPYVTLNTFNNVSAVGANSAASTLIDFAKSCDTNTFVGMTRLSLNFAGSVGVIYNSSDPGEIADVYGNHFEGELAIDIDAAGCDSVIGNNTLTSGSGPWANRIHHLRLGGSNPEPINLNDADARIVVPILLGTYLDSTRPTASEQMPGTMIWNRDDGAPNWSDGSNWVDATGSTT